MKDTPNTVDKRSILKTIGGAVAGSLAVGSASGSAGKDNQSEDGDENSRKVIYADEDKRLVKVGEFSYVVEGDYTEEERRDLIDEYVTEHDSKGVSTMATSDDGYASSGESIDDTHYLFTDTDTWAQSENRVLEFEGTATGACYRSAFTNTPNSVDNIKVTSVLKGYAEKEAASLSAPPSYTISYERITAKLTTSTPSGETEASRSLHHYDGAVTMEAQNCWVGAKQDDNVRFEFGGDAYFLGQAVDLDIITC